MAPPAISTGVSPPLSLVVRLLTLVSLFVSLILLATDTYTRRYSDYYYGYDLIVKTKAINIYTYRYLMAATVIGLVYTLLQVISNVVLVSSGNRIGGESTLLFDFYADKVISYILATGAAASLVLTVENSEVDSHSTFMMKATAASALCLVGSFFTIISSIFSSFSLPKRSS